MIGRSDVDNPHLINVDNSDRGHRAFCCCGRRGWQGPLRFEVEQALFDAADHVVRQLFRPLRRRRQFREAPAGPGLWPWLIDNQYLLDGELSAIVGLVAGELEEWALPAPVASRKGA